jgi:hypothetical protein
MPWAGKPHVALKFGGQFLRLVFENPSVYGAVAYSIKVPQNSFPKNAATREK